MATIYRRMRVEDLEQIIAIQNASLLGKVENSDLRDGFVQGEFTPETFKKFDASVGVMVAEENSHVIGYLCASNPESTRGTPLTDYLLELMQNTELDGIPLNESRCVLTGPICIDRDQRGKGLFEGLYLFLFENIRSHFDIAVAFVDSENPRSLAAHVKKLNMKVVKNYDYNSRNYDLIARKI
jgi:hypothetical protein